MKLQLFPSVQILQEDCLPTDHFPNSQGLI
jgi:hypothetical protein